MTGPACRDISPNCMLLRSAIKHAKAHNVDPAISRLDSLSKMFSFVSMIYKKKDVYGRGMMINLKWVNINKISIKSSEMNYLKLTSLFTPYCS